jgi:hypothetical protein
VPAKTGAAGGDATSAKKEPTATAGT